MLPHKLFSLSIYHTSWITSGSKTNFICENIPTKTILFSFGCSEVNSTWLITSELANQRARKVLFTCVVYTDNNNNIYLACTAQIKLYIFQMRLTIKEPYKNTMQCPRPGLEPELLGLETSTLNMRPLQLPQQQWQQIVPKNLFLLFE